MTIKLASLAADLKKEVEGDWIDIPDLPGVALKVRSLQSPAYSVARDLMAQKHRRKYGAKPVPPEAFSRDFGRIAAEHLLLDWRGFDVPYTAEGATEVLTSVEYRALLNHTVWAAAQVGEAEIEFVEDAAGNSDAPSATN